MKRIIMQADDVGNSPEANRAIAACVAAGTIKCVSVMTPGGYLEEAAALLSRDGSIDIGLHVTLNSEWELVKWGPLLGANRVPSLVDADGFFTTLPGDLKRNGFVIGEAMAEVAAQLARLRSVGLDPVYLDEHCHIGWVSGELLAALADFARREGLLFVTRDLPPLPGSGHDWVARVHAAPPGDYLIVTHPGYFEEGGVMSRFHFHGAPADGSVARERAAETNLLCDPSLVERLHDAGATFASYRDIYG